MVLVKIFKQNNVSSDHITERETREHHAAVLAARPQGQMKSSGKRPPFPEKLHGKGICPENMTFSRTNALKDGRLCRHSFSKMIKLAEIYSA